MWSAPVICQDGTVVPCCFDKDATYKMGSILENSLTDIWRNKSYQAFRQTIFNDRKSLGICRNCTEGSRFQ
jgi:radical SAM protein with 4Fe4S-binding SPASM domain